MRPHKLELAGQPLDRYYLRESRLFAAVRSGYGQIGGTFAASLTSSERSLSSAALLAPRIEYTPAAAELYFRARARDENISTLTQLSVSTFHEANHRIFWATLPAPERETSARARVSARRRYLNFIESLVVALDMALGDSLGPHRAAPGYQAGVIYDPGTFTDFRDAREARNYYHLALHATFLNLEGYPLKRVATALRARPTPLSDGLRDRAIERALKLDRVFVERTNPLWQRMHGAALDRFFDTYPARRRTLSLSEDPLAFHEEYVLAEQVFAHWRVGG